LNQAGENEGHPKIIWGCSGLNLHASEEGMECGIGRTITLDNFGDVFPCTLMMHPAFRLGNLKEKTFEEIARSTEMKTLYHTCLERKKTITECQRCAWQHFCQGGCPASVFARTGKLQTTDRLCELRDEFYRGAFLG